MHLWLLQNLKQTYFEPKGKCKTYFSTLPCLLFLISHHGLVKADRFHHGCFLRHNAEGFCHPVKITKTIKSVACAKGAVPLPYFSNCIHGEIGILDIYSFILDIFPLRYSGELGFWKCTPPPTPNILRTPLNKIENVIAFLWYFVKQGWKKNISQYADQLSHNFMCFYVFIPTSYRKGPNFPFKF